MVAIKRLGTRIGDPRTQGRRSAWRPGGAGLVMETPRRETALPPSVFVLESDVLESTPALTSRRTDAPIDSSPWPPLAGPYDQLVLFGW